MTKVALIKFLIFILFSTPIFAQKVKYKDIVSLLATKQYTVAEPFLKRYLTENTDNPNAFLYMGIVLQEKSAKGDILKNTLSTLQAIDSSILFYDKAYKTITEKEIKRNSEYYQAYNRRDLRTGEFGVKLSDIQLDVEKRTEGLRETKDRIKMVKHYFVLADSLYGTTNKLFISLQAKYKSERELVLQGDEKVIATLSALGQRFDSCLKAFAHYKSSLSTLPKSKYKQELKLVEIKDFKKDGISLSDFYQADVEVWDYRKFADDKKNIIVNEILPLNKRLVDYDAQLNKLREKLTADSISVIDDIKALANKQFVEQLMKFDTDPLPLDIFSLKTADLEYRSVVVSKLKSNDELDLNTRMTNLESASHYLAKLDSVAIKLIRSNLDERAENYTYFLSNTLGNTVILRSYGESLKLFADQERIKLDRELAISREALRWMIVNGDSIPLDKTISSTKFKPLFIEKEKFTCGLMYEDSVKVNGYFYSITPSRIPDINVLFPVDNAEFKSTNAANVNSLTFSDVSGQLYFVLFYSTQSNNENKYAATLAKMYRTDGLAWSNNYQLSFLPKEITFKHDVGELLITGGAATSVVDKNGKLIR